jgi:hypothetical protein
MDYCFEGSKGRWKTQGNIQHIAMQNIALYSGGVQQIQIVLLNVIAPNSAANSSEDHYKTLNTQYHHHTANFGTSSVAI